MHDWKSVLRARLGRLNVDPAREADIVDELAQHASDHFAELVAGGMRDEEAVAAVLAPLADPKHVAKEIARADRVRVKAAPVPPPAGGSIPGCLARDIRYGLRVLRRTPGFAAAAIITLALGIGANAAMFSIVRAVLLRPPPYHDPSRVVAFLNSKSGAAGSITSSSLPDFEDWRRQLTSFEGLGLLSGWTFNATGFDLPERVFGARVNGSLFRLLGTKPLLGRIIEPVDDSPDGDEVLVLGYRVWQRLFAGDRFVIGRAVMLEGRPHVVIGVMPPRFRFPSDDTEMWAAIKNNMTGMPREGRFMVAVGRLKPNVTLSAAQAEIDAVSKQLETAYPRTNTGWRVRLAGVHDATVGNTKPALVALMSAVGFVLLIACANVSNLLLARATSRQRETAVRLALGASRGRIVAQWLTENLLLAAIGGTCGVGLAFGAVQLIIAFGPTDVPRLDESTVDGAVLGFTLAVAMLAGALPALAPALRAVRVSTHSAMKTGLGGYSAASGSGGAFLIVCEVALAMTLAVAGTLVFKSFSRLVSVRPGFDSDRVLSLKVFLTPPRYRTVASGKQYIRSALDRIASVPGVEAVAAISQLPMGDPSSGQLIEIEGRPSAPGDRPSTSYRAVSPSYFDTLRIPIVRGRTLTDDDRETSLPVVVINEAMARRYWPNEDPIGRRIRWATGFAQFDERWQTIVGIAADVRSSGLDKPEPPALYQPFTQRVFPWLRWNSFVARTRGEPEAYAREIRQALTAIDPQQPIYQVASLDRVIAQSVAARRFHTGMIDFFAALALALCSVGVYGTVGCWVADRTREIGVRLALGATHASIHLLVVVRAAVLAAIGIVAGIGLSFMTSRMLSTLLFEVEPFDASTIVTVSTVILLAAATAAFVPARRASRLDPLTVIRGD